MSIFNEEFKAEAKEKFEDAKAKVKTGAKKVVNGIERHPVASAVAVSIVASMLKSAKKSKTDDVTYKRMYGLCDTETNELFIVNRKLSDKELNTVNKRVDNGEKTSDVLSDMKLK